MKEQGIELAEKNTKVLEIGSGNTVLLDYIRKQGVNITGVDINPRGSEDSPQVIARIEQLPFPDESFEVVFSTQVFDTWVYRQDQDTMMREIARVLKAGGVYVGHIEHIDSQPIEGFNLISDPSDTRWRVVYKKS